MKVGKNNFNPPPQVESSVVKLVPKVPRPAISFTEWDGMLRICFVRKNKTLRSAFLGTSSVMDMLTNNYRMWAVKNDIMLDDGPSEATADDSDLSMAVDDKEEEWAGIMDIDEEEADELPDFFKEAMSKAAQASQKGGKRKKRGKVFELVREKIRKVLEDETKLADKRSRLCDEGDFLKLLYGFNQEDIHFS
jgi:18S rRNA (adenine1779-N6/adenine1780-N6)-dimethyltransferase